MDLQKTEELLARCLEDYHTQRARGEQPDPSTFRLKLGEAYDEFHDLIAAESVIDEAMAPIVEASLPMRWGAYTLLRELGRGGAGVVYEAVYRKLGRKVAVKILRTGIDTTHAARQRFQREAQALAQVRHENIVEIYEFGDVGGQPFYAMELVEGESLADLIARNELLDPRSACRGMAGIAHALHALHEAGIVHRDVKPANIMIRAKEQFVLADFGLARTAMAATMTRTGDALGTPLFMSPEQMLGKRDAVDRRTDVYGAGATLYQLLSGQPPFKSDDLHGLVRMILSQRPEKPRSVRPDLPAGCSAIAMKCLEKETSDRYRTAADLAEDLESFADGRKVRGRPLTAPERGIRWLQKRPAVAAAAVLLIGLGAWFALRPAPPPEPARLSVQVFPPVAAVARIGSSEPLPTPLRGHELTPGKEYVLHVRTAMGGFGEIERRFTPSAEQELEWVLQIPVLDPSHPDVRKVFYKLAVVDPIDDVAAPDAGVKTRAPLGDASVAIGLPRGDVRLEDIARWQVQFSEAFPDAFKQGGSIEFRRGDDLLAEFAVPATPDSMDLIGEMPAGALEKIAAGDTITWGFRGAGQPKLAAAATFTVVPTDLEDRLRRIDERLAPMEAGQARERLRASLRTSLFLNQSLPTAAFHEAQSYLVRDPASLPLLNLQRVALRRLIPNRVQRASSSLWKDFVGRWNRRPKKDRAAYLAASRKR